MHSQDQVTDSTLQNPKSSMKILNLVLIYLCNFTLKIKLQKELNYMVLRVVSV